MPRESTRDLTLYRLDGVAPHPVGMLDALDHERVDQWDADIQETQIAGCVALWLSGRRYRRRAEWCEAASITTGLDVDFDERSAFGLLLLAVDDTVYGIGYGRGYLLISDDRKDHGFGIRFALRRLDPAEIQDVARRRIGARGRTDLTLVPDGVPIWMLGVEENADVVRRLGGRSDELAVTFSAEDQRPVRLEAGVGLRMRLGVRPEHLVGDIREIARVCAEESPNPLLQFVDNFRPIGGRARRDELDQALDAVLGGEHAGEVVAVVPTDCLRGFADARSFTIKVGSVTMPVDAIETEHFLARCRLQRPGQRVAALRAGKVRMFQDDRHLEELGAASAIHWLEAVVSRDNRRYFLLDGEWYEVDIGYLDDKLREIEGLFADDPSVDLPAWQPGSTERAYNMHVQDVRPGYLCMDREMVRTTFFPRGGFEACDVLGPDDALIHVKFAEGAGSLSHLFTQGAVSAQALLRSDEALTRFSGMVAQLSGGRRLIPPDFRPRKVVFAILLRKGDVVTPGSLFPLARVALANAARLLHTHGVEVEVVGVRGAADVT
ncbi:DUF6119 family protein [Jiangella rhizosphaerae]|uniref:Sporadically distributed protein, TIGR04141 family n=1 Tax=Jiangella rhizosphaerae TaxID=2293569 RepID=A0A418KQK6_9ACTN|nr:DUF6119 family protein [Jiangella rhizosphaerae]RIQ22840.1 hypothetical protein DY240_13370 [Jiangella rhizosphaerae]